MGALLECGERVDRDRGQRRTPWKTCPPVAKALDGNDDQDSCPDEDATLDPQTSGEENKSEEKGLECEGGSKTAEEPYLKETAGL